MSDRQIYWDNLKKDIERQLDWIGANSEDQRWLLEKAINFCQINLIKILNGQTITKKKEKTQYPHHPPTKQRVVEHVR